MLDALMRQGAEIPFSCRGGVCQVCLQRCVSGEPSAASVATVSPELRHKGYFLPCTCIPTGDMEFEAPRREDLVVSATVERKSLLAPDVMGVWVRVPESFVYEPGQFITLHRPGDLLMRSYSVASVPGAEPILEFHVRRMPDGEMSGWIFNEMSEGEELEIQGPFGTCHYTAAMSGSPLLLLGGGTGLAPLWGVVRKALEAGHQGEIHLYHGVGTMPDLYRHGELKALEAEYPSFTYHPCVSGEDAADGVCRGRIHAMIRGEHPELQGWQVFIAGPPDMVSAAQGIVLAAGAAAEDVHADSFEYRDLRTEGRAPSSVVGVEEDTPAAEGGPGLDWPPADLDLWNAVDGGRVIREVLEDFYPRVFADPRLKPFFAGLTEQRLIEKQYAFLRQIFTGEKTYFGGRPRNAHHWMVISDELFDYRARIMEECIRRTGLAEPLVERWMEVEDYYRPDIVKDKPFPRVAAGIVQPMDGYEDFVMEAGSLCDSCFQEIPAGTRIRYHVRLGTMYCPGCSQAESTDDVAASV